MKPVTVATYHPVCSNKRLDAYPTYKGPDAYIVPLCKESWVRGGQNMETQEAHGDSFFDKINLFKLIQLIHGYWRFLKKKIDKGWTGRLSER